MALCTLLLELLMLTLLTEWVLTDCETLLLFVELTVELRLPWLLEMSLAVSTTLWAPSSTLAESERPSPPVRAAVRALSVDTLPAVVLPRSCLVVLSRMVVLDGPDPVATAAERIWVPAVAS